MPESRGVRPVPTIALIIGGVFGTVFVSANGQLLGTAGQTAARVLAIATLIVVIALAVRGTTGRAAGERPAARFGTAYWAVVAAEAVALFGGLAVINLVLELPAAPLGWIAFVVGVHFVVLARVWREPALAVVGAVLTVLGLIGLVVAVAGGSVALVAFLAGFLSGIVLLGSCLATVLPTRRARSVAR